MHGLHMSRGVLCQSREPGPDFGLAVTQTQTLFSGGQKSTVVGKPCLFDQLVKTIESEEPRKASLHGVWCVQEDKR